MKEPHPSIQAGSRKESVRPGTSPEPAPGRAVMEDINSRESRGKNSTNAPVGSAGNHPIWPESRLARPCGALEISCVIWMR
jgi:hypothetical protein